MNKRRNRTLIVIDGGFVRQIQLDKDYRREWFLGRIGTDYRPDIPFSSSFVSRNQGSLQLTQGDWVYRNNPNSLYGTWYNEEPLGNAGELHKNEAKRLKNGDLLKICYGDKAVLMLYLDGIQTGPWMSCRLQKTGKEVIEGSDPGSCPICFTGEDKADFSESPEGHWYVENKDAQEGISVNHQMLHGRRLLNTGDLIESGDLILLFIGGTVYYSKKRTEEAKSADGKNSRSVILFLSCCIGLLCICILLWRGSICPLQKENRSETKAETTAGSLREDPGASGTLSADTVPGNESYILGNALWKRKEILKISLVSSLEEMPDDAWDVSGEENGSVFAWVDGAMHLYIGAEGVIRLPRDCTGLFAGYTNVRSIDFGNSVDTSGVISMQSMFFQCYHLEYIDFEGFETDQVESMAHMFEKCRSLTSLDLESFDTSAVKDMTAMFAECSSLETINVSSFNTGHVETMSGIFSDCSELSRLDLCSFDTAGLKDGIDMFSNCTSLQELKFDSYRFRTGSMTSMNSMFAGCGRLSSLDVSHFDTSQVRDMDKMFYMDASLTELAFTNFDMSRVMTRKDMLTGTRWQ